MMGSISIVIPTYNEADNLPKLITGISKKCSQAEIIIVDDNSPDKTWEVAQNFNKKFNVKVIRRMKERGLGSAVIEGFMHAQGNIIGVMDADLSHPSDKIPELIGAIVDGADIAVGSRLINGGGVEEWPFHRRIVSRIATLMARPLTNVKDPMSGFFFFNKKILGNCTLETKGYKILLEILVKADYNKVVEIPYIFRNREVGESKMGIFEYLKYLKQAIHLYNKNVKKQ